LPKRIRVKARKRFYDRLSDAALKMQPVGARIIHRSKTVVKQHFGMKLKNPCKPKIDGIKQNIFLQLGFTRNAQPAA
jgi:hypothetical protein